jgi:hypothetical protein
LNLKSKSLFLDKKIKFPELLLLKEKKNYLKVLI